MKRFLEILLFGFVAGALLSAMRAPLGLELVQTPAVLGTTAALHRAAALFALALVLGGRRRLFRGEVPMATLLLGATLGYAFHGLFVLSRFQPSSRVGAAAVLVVCTLVLLWLAGRAGGRGPAEEAPEEEGSGRLERIGLVVLGLGLAVALEHLAHEVRLFGGGLAEDDTVIGTVLLATLWIGALAFGHALPPRARTAPAALALAAAATWVGLAFLGRLSDQEGFYRYLKSFDTVSAHLPFGLHSILPFDLVAVGMVQVTAVIAGASFVAPGFLAGAGLFGARRGGRLASVLFGAGLGVLLFPYLLLSTAHPIEGRAVAGNAWAWMLFALGGACAGVGGVIGALGLRGRGRLVSLVLGALALGAPFLLPRPVVWPLSPWFPTPIEPTLVVPTPEGLVTVEPDRGTSSVVTVDRLRVTPTVDEEAVDTTRLRYAWSLLPADLRASGKARLLVIGQLTPSRRDLLASLGTMHLERTAPWSSALPAVERVLFQGWQPLAGKPLEPDEARRRIAAGDFDLVIVLPVTGPIQYPKSRDRLEWGIGPAPVTGWSVPEGTLAVVWVDAAAPLAERAFTGHVILAMDRFLHLSVGLCVGDVPTETAEDRPALFPGGEPARRIGAPTLLLLRPVFRGDRDRRDLVARLQRAAQGTPLAETADGLAIHYAAQKESSPFETTAQQIEIDEDELRAFDKAVRAVAPAPLDAFTRSIWEAIAWVLAEKRMPDQVLVYVEPVAEAYAPWPALDRAVARAYEEFGQPKDAARVLQRLARAEPEDIDVLVDAAEQSSLAGEHEEALDLARRADALQPGRYDLRRELGLVQMRAGDPAGRELLERLLREKPGDQELLDLLRQGPAPTGAGGG